MQTRQWRHVHVHQDLLLLRSEEPKCPSDPISGRFYTHRILLVISPSSIRKSELARS
jgi:hypothetical protein